MNKLVNYLRSSHEKNILNPVGERYFSGLRVDITHPVQAGVNLEGCFSYVFDSMPSLFFSKVKQIKIGQFPFLKSRQVEAIYKNGIIYLTNDHENNHSVISDLVHEIAHSFEEDRSGEIYGDGYIKEEFISKREKLYYSLESLGLISYPITKNDFFETTYTQRFDEYLHTTVGYEKIQQIAMNLFISPYATTCLREYFANGFENFFINDINVVKKISPNIYNKILSYLEI
jgi:hypothetical protein